VAADKLLTDRVLLDVIEQRASLRNAPAKPSATPQSDRGG